MKLRSLVAAALAVVFTLCAPNAFAYIGWAGADGNPYYSMYPEQTQYINISSNKGTSYSTQRSVKVDSNGYACIAWEDNSGGNHDIYFIRWNGKEWVNVRGEAWPKFPANVSNNEGYSASPCLVIDKNNNPHLAWDDDTTGKNEIYYVRWDGKDWVNALGLSYPGAKALVSTNSTLAMMATFVLDTKGFPHMVWQDGRPGQGEIMYLRFTGKQWINASGENYPTKKANVTLNAGDSSMPVIALDKADLPIIAWQDTTLGEREIFCVKWSSKQWSTLDGRLFLGKEANVSLNEGMSSFPCIISDSIGNPYLAWDDDTTGDNEIFLIRWNGTDWVNMYGRPYPSNTANISQNTGFSEFVSFVLDGSNNPHVVWDDRTYGTHQICYIKWNGKRWVNAYGMAYPQDPANINDGTIMDNYLASISLASNGVPHVVWNMRAQEDPNAGDDDDAPPPNVDVLYVKMNSNYDLNPRVTTTNNIGDGVDITPGTEMEYNFRLEFDKGTDPLINSFIYAQVPKGSKYNGGAFPKTGLWYSTDVGKTWLVGEPPAGTGSGVYLKWAVTGWHGAAGSQFVPSLPMQKDSLVTMSKSQKMTTRYSMAIDSKGYPHIAWDDMLEVKANEVSSREVFYAKWNGSSWVSINGKPVSMAECNVSVNTGESKYPVLALDSSDRPNICWADDYGGNFDIYFVKWDGSKWVNVVNQPYPENLANVSRSKGFSEYPSLVLDKNSNPVICWDDDTVGNLEVLLIRWNGREWTTAEGQPYNETTANITKNAGTSEYASLALDADGNPCVTWDDTSTKGTEIMYIKYDGTAWVGANGKPYTAENANVSKNLGFSEYPSLAIDSKGNPHIAWDDDTPGNMEVFYTRWNGEYWVNAQGQEYDGENANVSRNQGLSEYPYLAIDAEDNACIVWDDNTFDYTDIYMVRWNGMNWVSGSGQIYPTTSAIVSMTPGDAYLPVAAFDKKGNAQLFWGDIIKDGFRTIYAKWEVIDGNYAFSIKVDSPFDIKSNPIVVQPWFRHQYDFGKICWSNKITNQVKLK
jgi:hypothetical protein